jgi:hypothetical protein
MPKKKKSFFDLTLFEFCTKLVDPRTKQKMNRDLEMVAEVLHTESGKNRWYHVLWNKNWKWEESASGYQEVLGERLGYKRASFVPIYRNLVLEVMNDEVFIQRSSHDSQGRPNDAYCSFIAQIMLRITKTWAIRPNRQMIENTVQFLHNQRSFQWLRTTAYQTQAAPYQSFQRDPMSYLDRSDVGGSGSTR